MTSFILKQQVPLKLKALNIQNLNKIVMG